MHLEVLCLTVLSFQQQERWLPLTTSQTCPAYPGTSISEDVPNSRRAFPLFHCLSPYLHLFYPVSTRSASTSPIPDSPTEQQSSFCKSRSCQVRPPYSWNQQVLQAEGSLNRHRGQKHLYTGTQCQQKGIFKNGDLLAYLSILSQCNHPQGHWSPHPRARSHQPSEWAARGHLMRQGLFFPETLYWKGKLGPNLAWKLWD